MFISPDDLETVKKLNLKHPYVWLATWFGAGFIRPAPGTWGSLMAVPPGLILFSVLGLKGLFIATVLVVFLGLWASRKFEQATGTSDHKMIVIDEVAGQWIAMIPSLLFTGLNPFWIALSFLIFRLFDITKPWPINWLDRNVKGPAGVMGDDIIAGLISACAITGIYYAGLG